MLTRAVVLALLVSGCAIDDETDVETDVVEEASLNCPTSDPDCDPYPTPPPRKPDLVATFVTGTDGRCYWDNVSLRFGVKNTGTATAPASTVRLEFSASYGRSYSVPSLAPGASHNLYETGIRYDFNCYTAGCTARVVADYAGTVNEASETNNKTTRLCEIHF